MYSNQYTIGNDILDSRAIQDRLDEIRALPAPRDPWDVQEYRDLFRVKRTILDTFSFGSSWDYGIILISESYWEEYAEQTAYDIGMVDENSSIASYIDWERWADALTQDYSQLDIDGYKYYARD